MFQTGITPAKELLGDLRNKKPGTALVDAKDVGVL